jgi:hypothetical protein
VDLKRLITSFVVAILILSLSGVSIAAAPPIETPGKGPPELTKTVFVHYPKGLEAKGGIPGPPDKEPKPDDGDGGGGKLWYKDSGIHWVTPGADFLYNPAGAPPGDYLDAIQQGFDTWTTVEGSNFTFGTGAVTTVYGISSLDDWRDGNNVVGWADLNAEGFTNAIAVTMIWYMGDTILEVDMAFSNNPEFEWKQNLPGDEEWDFNNTIGKYDVDVQNIATHEAGHWLLLEDMYNKPANQQTMYGISAEFDLKKRSLESGDIAGIIAIYPS